MKAIASTILLGALALGSPVAFANDKNIVETAVAAGSFKTLAAALGAADLVKPLQGKGPFTVFAPTDDAFAKLPKGTVEDLLKPENKDKLQAVLKFHVIQGEVGLSDALAAKSASTLQGAPVRIGFTKGQVKVNNATLVTADLKTSNGVIHVIDTVLLPPAPKNDIASVAKKAGQFGTLLAAVDAAGLTKALSGKGPLTVFAPTDAAFEALPKGTVQSLLQSENRKKLMEILALHVVAGKVSAGDALNAGKAKAMSGGKLAFAIDNGSFKVNGATIVTTDIQCDNGVIHVIDAVLLPDTECADDSCDSESKAVMAPTKEIEMAIAQGVPVFNHGNHSKCAEIYMNCVTALAGNQQVDCSVRQSMSALASKAGNVHCKTTRAWMLRGGLDEAYATLSN